MVPMARGNHRRPKDSSATRVGLVLALGTAAATPAVIGGSAHAATVSAWDRIAQCESGSRWNLPYGDASSTGGLQIQKPTWDAYGGTKYARYPYQATKSQQIAIAEKILARQGPRAWTCNAMVGYPLKSSGPNSSYLKGGSRPYAAAPPAAAHHRHKPAPKAFAPKRQDARGHYVVKPGDTLYGITVTFSGDRSLNNWRPLYEANRRTVHNPNLIYPGQSLNAPPSWSGKSYKVAPRAGHTAASAPRSKRAAPASNPVGSGYVLPVHGRWGDGVINHNGCVSRSCGGHSGQDIMAASGTVVRAAGPGTVVSMNHSGAAYGLHVVVKHPDGRFTLYAHMSAIVVKVGQHVKGGQQVGNVGATGNASGPHLHFEVRTNPTAFSAGIFLQPSTWLRSHGVSI